MLIIAVSGVTNGGKSTVAEALQNALPKSVLIRQDTYFLPKDSNHHVLLPEFNHFNWEIMSSLDMDKMWEDINYILKKGRCPKTLEKIANTECSRDNSLQNVEKQNWESSTVKVDSEENTDILNQAQVLIIEGFLVLNYQKIADVADLKYHLTLNKEDCYNRRISREYDPPDVPGYFDSCVWPEYIKHKEEMLKKVKDVKVIDGTRDIRSILDEIVLDIVDKLKSSILE